MEFSYENPDDRILHKKICIREFAHLYDRIYIQQNLDNGISMIRFVQ